MSQFCQRSDDKKEKLYAENSQILHWLQSLLINASLLVFSVLLNFSPLHHIFICETHALPQFRQFWNAFRAKLANKRPYKASISSMRLRLQEPQETNFEAQDLRTKDGYYDINGVLHHQGLPFMPKAIRMELISRHYNDFLESHFGIVKTQEFLARKYYWPTLWHNVKAYIKDCDICLASKAVRYKPYGDFQSLLVPTYW